jgi:hypothetical protein
MYIKPGVDAQCAAAEIDTLIDAAQAIPNLIGDMDSSAFASWVHDVERTLREWFVDVPIERLTGRLTPCGN